MSDRVWMKALVLTVGFCPLTVGFAFAQTPFAMPVVIPSNPSMGLAGGHLVVSSLIQTPQAPVSVENHPKVSTLRLYVIQQDDNLWDLAGAFYGEPWLWPLFLKFNSIPNPDLIYPGRALLFPSMEVLMNIRKKTPEQVTAIREKLEAETTTIILDMPPTPPGSKTANPPVSKPVTEGLAKGSPTPTPQKTPTFKITGSKTINLSYAEAVGNSANGFTNTGFDRHETLRLQMEGQLNDEMKLTGHFAQSDLALDDDYDLTLSTKHWELFFGNFQAALPGSQFLSTSLSTTGLRLTGKYDDWNLTSLYGTPRGRSIYEKFFGNGTQGPYTVPDVPIVPGSEVIWVNKQKLTRGVDYNLDYTVGYLTFTNRMIQLTDLIEIEAQSRSSVFETQVYGYRVEKVLIGPVAGVKSANGVSQTPTLSPTPTIGSFPATVGGAYPNLSPGMAPATTGVTLHSPGGNAGANPLKGAWTLGQGYMRQLEQPDANVTTATGRVAGDTHLFELDSTLDLGPPLKLTGEVDGSAFISSNETLASSKQGLAYRGQGDTFQGPFHVQGKISGTTPSFTGIGNPLASGNYLDWTLLGDFKEGSSLFAQADRTYQRQFATGTEDDTTTDHAEAKAKPKDFPEVDYVYYLSDEERPDPVSPFQQQTLRNTLSLSFGLPAKLGMKVSAEQESQQGNNLGTNNSVGGKVELASQKWAKFNFNLSGEWKLTNVIEAGSNTSVPQTAPGNNIPSQTYTYTMEGKPFDHLTLTGKGTYSDAPPGPTKANMTETYQADPFKWLKSNGSYSLDFQQAQALGATIPDQIHTGSGSLEVTPLTWLKLSAQPSFRLDVLAGYGNTLSQNFHQNYRAALTPSFGNLSGDYTLDQFWTWDGSTAGFPLNFYQQTETINVAAKKAFGKVSEEVSYKRSNQNQQNISPVLTTSSHTLNQTETDSTSWSASTLLTFTFTHNYNQLNQDSPGQGNLTNPLLPNGTDTFNTAFAVNPLNAFTYSHTFTGRVTEQFTKTLSIYEEGGYTKTVDVLQGGAVDTYSPAAGFTWKPGSFLNWTASYQYNGSSGEVSTTIQKAQTTLAAALNPASSLSVNWSWSRADNPFIISQQGTVAYTMNF